MGLEYTASGDYARTPEEGDDYYEFSTYVSDQYKITQSAFKHSEFKNPNADDYESMDTEFNYTAQEYPLWALEYEPIDYDASEKSTSDDPIESIKWCQCNTIKIGYTSKSVACGGQTTLTAKGTNLTLCDSHEITWEITGGEGTLTQSSGLSTVYLAPEENINCADNPTIKLTCNSIATGTYTATITLSVNCVTTHIWSATVMCTHVADNRSDKPSYCPCPYGCNREWYCDGTQVPVSYVTPECSEWGGLELGGANIQNKVADECYYTGYNNGYTFFHLVSGVKTDVRTAALIAAGCCPPTA